MTKQLGLAGVALLSAVWLLKAQALPGFVSGEVLKDWCSKNEGLDREACYSYLRGASDAFHAVARVSTPASGGENPAPYPNECMPAQVSITSLRDVFLDFAARQPERLNLQAAYLLAEVLARSFPCAEPEIPNP